jgi:hypothetical protein
MGTAKNGIDQVGAALSGIGAVAEANQIQAQLIDDLFGFGEKVLYRFTHVVVGAGHKNLSIDN